MNVLDLKNGVIWDSVFQTFICKPVNPSAGIDKQTNKHHILVSRGGVRSKILCL